MLPSRGIARSLPSAAGAPRQIQARWTKPPSALPQRLRRERQFGTSPRGAAGVLAAGSPLRSRSTPPAAPIALTSARAFSLWGFGRKTPAPGADAPPVAAPDPEPEADLASISDMVNSSALSNALSGADVLSMPEQLGYLHAIGLDYGWGPTSLMQWLLEHVHVWSGLGWAGSIAATAVLLRVALFYPQVRALCYGAVAQEMRRDPRSKEAMELIQDGFRTGDMEKRRRGQMLNKLLRQHYGVSPWGVLWSFAQIPFPFGFFRVITGMTHVPVPSLETAGFLWFTDLTATDPYLILPALSSSLMAATVLVNMKYTPPEQRKMMKPIMYVFGIGSFVATTFLSAAVNIMAATIGATTALSALILRSAAVRRRLGLPVEAPRPPPSLTPTPTYEAPRPAPASLRERLTRSLNDVKKGFTTQVESYTGTYSGTLQEKAEQRRKDMLRKLEEIRKEQERQEFESKYKGKR